MDHIRIAKKMLTHPEEKKICVVSAAKMKGKIYSSGRITEHGLPNP
jgi:hypothetical protein